MAKSDPSRTLSSRLLKAVEDARAPMSQYNDVTVAKASPVVKSFKVPVAGLANTDEARAGGVLGAGKINAPAQAPTKVATKAKKKRLIKTSTAGEALRRHVAEATTADLTTPRYLIQIKAPEPVATSNLPRMARPVTSVMTPRYGRPDGGAPIDDAFDLGRLIRQTRDRYEMTQADLAQAAGVGRRFISDLEAGKPTAELGKALTVCRALGLSLLAAPSS